MEFADLLAQARPAERSIRLCLRGDLVAEFEALERNLAKARRQGTSSLAGDGGRAIAEQMEALREQMDAFTVAFRLRALSRRAFQGLVSQHPPRRDAEGKTLPEDEEGVDASTFPFALVRACVVEPEMTDEQYARLVDDVLSDRQFESLANAALVTCRGDVDIPFSVAASALMSSSGDESSAPNGSASLSGASTAGSLATPSNTTTPDD